MTNKKIWDLYKNKQVRLFIIDGEKIRPRDGIFLDLDETHIFILIDDKEEPVSFLRSSIKRVEVRD